MCLPADLNYDGKVGKIWDVCVRHVEKSENRLLPVYAKTRRKTPHDVNLKLDPSRNAFTLAFPD